ncbi:MAG: HNH endonuclease, partial [Caldilineaceae bacterium]
MKVKDFVRSRAHGRCEYCLTPDDFSTDAFTLDHIVPVVLGGANHSDNLAYGCQACNSRKQDAVSAL